MNRWRPLVKVQQAHNCMALFSYIMQDASMVKLKSLIPVSAGLDYPAVGPQHLKSCIDIGRWPPVCGVTDDEAPSMLFQPNF